MTCHWKVLTVVPEADGPGAVVEVRAEEDDGQLRGEGAVRVTVNGTLREIPGGGPPALPDSLKGAVGFALGGLRGLEQTVAEAARFAKLIPPADPKRNITTEPRILTVAQNDELGEGCVVVVDDLEAIAKSEKKYRGPQPLNLDFIEDPPGLPGRKYLSVTDSKGTPIPPPRTLNDRIAIFDGEDTRLILTGAFATIYRSWQDADDAIRTAREVGVLP
jgi:hypothetical protein